MLVAQEGSFPCTFLLLLYSLVVVYLYAHFLEYDPKIQHFRNSFLDISSKSGVVVFFYIAWSLWGLWNKKIYENHLFYPIQTIEGTLAIIESFKQFTRNMPFLVLLFEAFAWKYLEFQSPSLSHITLDLYFHISSSFSSHFCTTSL